MADSGGSAVTVVLPPDVDTPQLAGESATRPAELAALNSGTPITADAVARALLLGAARGKATVVPSLSSRLTRWFAGVAPGLMARLMEFSLPAHSVSSTDRRLLRIHCATR
ncbi:hypothetical protein DFR76_11179 [Nocardia pseudobrasiliensis]|uniref:Uncharacterized protein n=1 Tax=Nocardia pseudobrasiliensis TaxID=45979 RepID=A0A370HX28_9NOCA|nr:hypothetical protein DFR76_11179 [Nocardia pseudobrasiliensis]